MEDKDITDIIKEIPGLEIIFDYDFSAGNTQEVLPSDTDKITNQPLIGLTGGSPNKHDDTGIYRWELKLIDMEDLLTKKLCDVESKITQEVQNEKEESKCDCPCHLPQKEGDFISHMDICCINGIKI
jgi:hypothetical protein